MFDSALVMSDGCSGGLFRWVRHCVDSHPYMYSIILRIISDDLVLPGFGYSSTYNIEDERTMYIFKHDLS